MKVLQVRSSHKNSNSKKKQSQFSIIFILASQYRSHSVLLTLWRRNYFFNISNIRRQTVKKCGTLSQVVSVRGFAEAA